MTARETLLHQGYPTHKRLCLHWFWAVTERVDLGVLGETCQVHVISLVLVRHVIWRGHHDFRHVLILLIV